MADGVVGSTFISSTFVVDEGVTAIGIISATLSDADAGATTPVTISYSIGATTGPVTLGNQPLKP